MLLTGPTIRLTPSPLAPLSTIIRKKQCRLAREYPSLPPLDHDHVYVSLNLKKIHTYRVCTLPYTPSM
jgi:hypothetical protein